MNRSSTLYALSILDFNYCIWSNFIYKSPQFDSGSLNHRQSLNRPGSHVDDTSICEEKNIKRTLSTNSGKTYSMFVK